VPETPWWKTALTLLVKVLKWLKVVPADASRAPEVPRADPRPPAAPGPKAARKKLR